jgi:hypothetical protein
MVRSLWTYRIQACGASFSCPTASSPRTRHPDHNERTRGARALSRRGLESIEREASAGDPVNREPIFCAFGVLSASPLTYFMRQDDSDLMVFCFANPEDAEAFSKYFGGEHLPESRQ